MPAAYICVCVRTWDGLDGGVGDLVLHAYALKKRFDGLRAGLQQKLDGRD